MAPPKKATGTTKKAAPKPPTKSAQDKAMDKFMENMDKSYGPGRFQIGALPERYEVISTGSLKLDTALIVGGYVRGRLAELWGPEGVGKSTMAIFACVQALTQFLHLRVLWVDVEHRHDKAWMAGHGMDLKRTVIVQPDNAEEVADIVKDACRSGLFSMVVVDSIGAMIPEIEKEKDADKAVVAKQAQIVTRMVKIAAVEADKSKTVVLFINQVRAIVGATKGAQTTTGGGFALKHGTTMKLAIKRGYTNDDDSGFTVGSGENKQRIGHLVAVNVERNSVALAFRKAQFGLLYVTTEQYGPRGIDRAMEAFDVGLQYGLIEGSGWYTNKLTGERLNGKAKVIESLRSQPDVVDQIRTRVIEMLAEQVQDDGGVTLSEDHEILELEDPDPAPESAVPEDELAALKDRMGEGVLDMDGRLSGEHE